MENLHQEINEITAYQVDSKRIEQLERKQRPKTKVQRLKGFFTILFVTGVIIFRSNTPCKREIKL
jgi:hypothetical protein